MCLTWCEAMVRPSSVPVPVLVDVRLGVSSMDQCRVGWSKVVWRWHVVRWRWVHMRGKGKRRGGRLARDGRV